MDLHHDEPFMDTPGAGPSSAAGPDIAIPPSHNENELAPPIGDDDLALPIGSRMLLLAKSTTLQTQVLLRTMAYLFLTIQRTISSSNNRMNSSMTCLRQMIRPW